MSHLPIPTFIQNDLVRVEAIIRERIESQSVVVRAAGQRVLNGGERLRASLALLAAHLGKYDADRVLHAAATVELIHAALHVHENLIDEADRRRGQTNSNSRWEGDVALMIGDYLLALAASEMALAPDQRIIAYFSRAVMTISEGELAPVLVAAPLEQAREQYMYKIGCRTAALIEAGCKAGMVGGAGSTEQIEALGRFGYDVGLALQIVEDVRDLDGSADPANQAVAENLREGIITLPLIYAVAEGADSRLASLVDQEQISADEVAWAIGQIQRSGGAQRALDDARNVAERALGHLRMFPASPALDALHAIVSHVVDAR